METRLAQDIRIIDAILDGQQPLYDYPVNPTKEFVEYNGTFNAGRSFVKAILCCLASKKPKSFKNNADVFINNDWLKRANSKNYHHFFPKGSFKGERANDERINHIANITIVDDYLNKRVIRAKRPSVYIGEFSRTNRDMKKTLRTHLINMDSAGVLEDNYDKFFNYRCRAIARELSKPTFPILGVFRLNGQPKRDGSIIVRSCKASQSPVYPIRDAFAVVEHPSCPSSSSSCPLPVG